MWKGSVSSSLQLSQVAQASQNPGSEDNPKPLLGETLQSSQLKNQPGELKTLSVLQEVQDLLPGLQQPW